MSSVLSAKKYQINVQELPLITISRIGFNLFQNWFQKTDWFINRELDPLVIKMFNKKLDVDKVFSVTYRIPKF